MIINPLNVKSENIIYIYQKYFKMKKVIILMLLSISNIYGQDTIKPIFNGFGILKVNTTTISVIKELETILNTQTRIINSSENESKLSSLLKEVENPYSTTNEKYGVICILLEDSTDTYKNPIYASSCEKVKVFRIGGYSVSGIKVTDLKITFLNDTLIDINCNNTRELMEAIHLKYGEGKKRIENKEIECTLRMTGNIITYEESILTEEWENNDIMAYERIKKYYDDKCNPQYINYLTIYSRTKKRIQSECERNTKKRREEKKKQEKMKTLNDF